MIEQKNEGGGCIICGCHKHHEYLPGLLECDSCGFVWADLTLSYKELQRIYDKNYFFGDEYVDYLSESEVLKVGFTKFERKIAFLFSSSKIKPKLLELGCAYGLFLDLAKNDFDVTGIEISDDPVHYCQKKGLSVFQGDILSYNNSEQFDVFVSFATFEHLIEPHKVTEKIYQLLKPGGYCYISTIDKDSRLAQFRGRKWRMIHPPTHVSYFSTKTLSNLLEKNGFSILECKPIWQYRSIDALLLPRMEGTLFLKAIHMLKLHEVPIPFNFGDIIGILAQKQ